MFNQSVFRAANALNSKKRSHSILDNTQKMPA